MSAFFKTLLNKAFDYETQKVVHINSKRIGISFRIIQLNIVMYLIGWVLIYEKGYQAFDEAVSGVTAKVKGIAFVNSSLTQGAMLFDAADYSIPPQQNSAFFVMTNLVYTPGQTLDSCEECLEVYGNDCRGDKDCVKGKLIMYGSGVQTGRCVDSTRAQNMSVCEIYGWCPTKNEQTPRPHLLGAAENITVLLKNSIEFPRFGVKRRNILSWMSKKYLQTCRYNPDDDKMKFCPIFRLGDIIKYSKANQKDIWVKGGMVAIQIEWSCNLDFNEEHCTPNYSFRRLDDFASAVGEGWNFRFSHHYVDPAGKPARTLVKAYGIQFFITVYGKGGQFDFITLSMKIGSGAALLGIATVLCDMVILNVVKKRGIYRQAKVDLVNQTDPKQKLAHVEVGNDGGEITGSPRIRRYSLQPVPLKDVGECTEVVESGKEKAFGITDQSANGHS